MTSKHEARGEMPAITRRRSVLACARCRARRVKCDRCQPACSNCSKAGTLCQPASTTPHVSTPPQAGRRDPIHHTRLSQFDIEAGSYFSKSPSREPSYPPSPDDSSDRGNENRGKLVAGLETRYMSPFSWAAVAEEVADIEAMLGGISCRTDDPESSDSPDDYGSPLPDDQLHETLLNIFSHHVDPLIRLVHWPSFLESSRAFRRSRTPPSLASTTFYPSSSFDESQQGIYQTQPVVPSQSQAPPIRMTAVTTSDVSFLALLYSVYYAAVTSVIDSPNPPNLGPNINAFNLAATFKREISNRVMAINDKVAGFESLQMLQAVVLNLSVGPILQLQWLQLGVAIRMARGLGVHRDGSNFGLRPIEIEVRRRLWAQLCILDVRFAEKLCREPTIDMNFYDTALPLSICDAELSELDEQHLSSKRGQTSTFKTHLHVEQEQERFSPFSVMTLTLVEAETARLMAQLHNTRYRARDSIFNNSSSSPNLARQSTSSAASRFEKVRWVNRLETRFQSVYKLNTLDSSNPKQLLVLETVEINIAKAKFVTRLLEWREVNGGMGDPHRDGEIAKLFREATSLATRGLSISHQYSGTPYSWYTKYLRDTYTTSFMAVCLASEAVLIEPEELHSAWSVLQQLFPLEATPSVAEASVSKSLFSKVLLKVRARHETTFRAASSHVMRGQAIYTAAGDIHHFPTSMSTNLPVSLPTRVGGVGTFQSSGNLFEDFDAIMQEPLWAPTLENVDNGYDGSWTISTPATSTHPSPSLSQSQPFDQPQIYQQTGLKVSNLTVPGTFHTGSRPSSPSSGIIGPSGVKRQASLPPNMLDGCSAIVHFDDADHSSTTMPHALGDSSTSSLCQLGQSRTWLLNNSQQLSPPKNTRDRSTSQPEHVDYLEMRSQTQLKRRSMTNMKTSPLFPQSNYDWNNQRGGFSCLPFAESMSFQSA